MEKGLYVALSGAVAGGVALDNVAHNVANADTPGFRASRVRFDEVLAGRAGKTPHEVVATTTSDDTRPGTLRTTENPLDLALRGAGTFVVEGEGGRRAVRSAAFEIDAGGALSTRSGERLLGTSGEPIEVGDAKRVAIGPDGVVEADGVAVGQILRNPGEAEGEPPEVVSGALESSNFSTIEGMVELIRVERRYEALTRMIEGYKELDQRSARELGTTK